MMGMNTYEECTMAKDEKEEPKPEPSRAEIIIRDLECGGFAESELDDIQEVLEKAYEELD